MGADEGAAAAGEGAGEGPDALVKVGEKAFSLKRAWLFGCPWCERPEVGAPIAERRKVPQSSWRQNRWHPG